MAVLGGDKDKPRKGTHYGSYKNSKSQKTNE